MEDKTFELIEKMYVEFSSKFNVIDNRLNNIEHKLDQKADKSDIIRLENDLKPKQGKRFYVGRVDNPEEKLFLERLEFLENNPEAAIEWNKIRGGKSGR